MSGRYQTIDSDEERLPEGVQRVGYDADEQRYYYTTSDGQILRGEEGARYGRLYPTNSLPTHLSTDAADPESLKSHLAATTRETLRYALPFLLLVLVFLLAVSKLLSSSGSPVSPSPGGGDAPEIDCDPGIAEPMVVEKGDTCWAIAQRYKIEVRDLEAINMNLDCGHLLAGQEICVPITED